MDGRCSDRSAERGWTMTSASATAGDSRQMTVSQLDRELRRFVEEEAKWPEIYGGGASALGLEAVKHYDALRIAESLQHAQAVADSWDRARETYSRRAFVLSVTPVRILGPILEAMTGRMPRPARLRIPLGRRRPRRTVIVG